MILKYLFESKKPKSTHSINPNDENTGENVGSGIGKTIGGLIGGSIGSIPGEVAGQIAGHYIGKNEGKDIKYNKNSKLHRIAALQDKRNSAVNTGLTSGGIAAGALAGMHAAYNYDDPALIPIGAAIGSLPGMIKKGISGYKTAKKMGYGTIGKIVSSVTPLSGLGQPQSKK